MRFPLKEPTAAVNLESLQFNPMKLQPKQTIDKRYQIIERLGQGGMGEVWKATDQRMGDEVVLKFPLSGGDETSLRRFGREAQAMARFAAECILPKMNSLRDLPIADQSTTLGSHLRIDSSVLPSQDILDMKSGKAKMT